jgi:hypothetical protein
MRVKVEDEVFGSVQFVFGIWHSKPYPRHCRWR